MGYSYELVHGGRGRLVCDNCGNAGGVRKRTCPEKVLHSSRGSSGRHLINYCYPPALCAACYKQEGGLRGVHADCVRGALAAQVEEDAIQVLLDAGEYLVASAFGDWHEDVPKGLVGVLFRNDSGDEQWLLVPKDAYSPSTKLAMSLYLGVAVAA